MSHSYFCPFSWKRKTHNFKCISAKKKNNSINLLVNGYRLTDVTLGDNIRLKNRAVFLPHTDMIIITAKHSISSNTFDIYFAWFQRKTNL